MEIKGKTRLNKKDIEILRGMVMFVCQSCRKHEDKVGTLQPHRINPKYQGGLYIPNNILMLCDNCHKLRAEQW